MACSTRRRRGVLKSVHLPVKRSEYRRYVFLKSWLNIICQIHVYRASFSNHCQPTCAISGRLIKKHASYCMVPMLRMMTTPMKTTTNTSTGLNEETVAGLLERYEGKFGHFRMLSRFQFVTHWHHIAFAHNHALTTVR